VNPKTIVKWKGIKKRCINPNYEHCAYYLDKGIQVCSEWKSFKPFYSWAINNGYEDGLQIDRIDVDGNYEPINCRWVTPKENSRNKSNNRKVLYCGEYKTIAELSEISGLSKKTITDRLDRAWSEEELLQPQRMRKNIRKYTGTTHTINGITKSITEWSDIIGISSKSFWDRLNNGWTDDELLLPKGSYVKRKSK